MDEENKFIHNLTRLVGPTNAVTIDSMLNTLLYIDKNSITEAQFIESSYLESIIDDEEFLTPIGSIRDLYNKYEKAIWNSDHSFLSLLHKKHKIAKAFLDNDVVKQQIKAVIETRKPVMENKAIWTTITNILELVQQFPHSNISRFLGPLLPKILQSVTHTDEVTDNNYDNDIDYYNNLHEELDKKWMKTDIQNFAKSNNLK